MARTSTTSRTGGERADLYQTITDKIIAELKAGRVPWVQPWDSSKASLDMPRNGRSGDRYSREPERHRQRQYPARARPARS